MLVAPVVTILVGLYVIHIPMLIGIVFLTTGLVAAPFVRRIWQLFLTQDALVGSGIGCTYIPTMSILAQWFRKRRSLVYGISASEMGVVGLLFPIQGKMQNFGLR